MKDGLRYIGLDGEALTCSECGWITAADVKGAHVVIGTYSQGQITGLRCAQCRGPIVGAAKILDELKGGGTHGKAV